MKKKSFMRLGVTSLLLLSALLTAFIYFFAYHGDHPFPLEDPKNISFLNKINQKLMSTMTAREVRSSRYINEEVLQSKIQQGLGAWGQKQIQEDLSPFKKPFIKKAFTKEDLKRYFNENKHQRIFYVEIQNGKVTMTKPLWTSKVNSEKMDGNVDKKIDHKLDDKTDDKPDNKSTEKNDELKKSTESVKKENYYHEKWIQADLAYPVIYDALQYLAEKKYISDTTFIIGLGDYIPTEHPPTSNLKTTNQKTISNQPSSSETSPIPIPIPIPIFTFARDNQHPIEKHFVLFPDWMNLRFLTSSRKEIRKGNLAFPWDKKKSLLFWRGGSFDSTGFRKKLVDFSKIHPELLDARFVTEKNQQKEFVTLQDHLQYKYQMSIDGQRASWERLVWQLHSNCLVFKHDSQHVQWFYQGIAPYVHYLPVKDESSLLSLFSWVESHPKEVQTMIGNANLFAENNLSLEDMYLYIIVLLREYNHLMESENASF